MNDSADNIIEMTPTSDSLDTIGGRILKAREELDITVPQLARRLGIKASTLQSWEQDKSEPRSNKLVMLAGVLNVSPSWLLMGQGEAPGSDSNHEELSAIALREELSQLRQRVSEVDTQLQSILARV